MDRLSALIVVAALAACEEKQESGPPPSRVNAVKKDPAAAKKAAASFCDVEHPPGQGPAFLLPTLSGSAPKPASGWRWVNIWATWCKPCVEEIPMLRRWRDKLAGTRPFDLQFVSGDASDEELEKYRTLVPDAPDGPRILDYDALPTWLASLGLPGSPTLPVHVLVDPQGRTRCVRAAAVEEKDLAAVEALLAGS
jgi:thiol-disulfide isomerase/thioredoxin